MEYPSFTKSVLITLIAMSIGACSGSGSGSGLPADNTAGDPAPFGGDATEQVTVTVTNPAASSTMETPDPAVVLAGTADSSAEIVSVTWVSSSGAEGVASGSESWKTESVPLTLGKNSITVTAEDSMGETASETVVVIREGGGSGSVELSWQAPTQRTDGSPLTDLAGFRIHYGRMSETYDYEIDIDNPGVLTYLVEGLASGDWYFVASAYDADDVESNFSNEVHKKVP